MAQIYDNIDVKFTDGLQGIISSLGVKRVDFCVGYFNLRGWNLVVDQIDKLPGDVVYENDIEKHRTCRLLIGMHRPPEELIRQLYSGEEYTPDANDAQNAQKISAISCCLAFLRMPIKQRFENYLSN